MEINSAAANSVSALVNSPQPQQQPAPKSDNQPKPQQQQDSVVVQLSDRAKDMNRAESQNNDAGRAETKPKEAAKPPGIQFMAGETKGGRVNTFA